MCEKHKQRKRKDCPDCARELGIFPELPKLTPEAIAQLETAVCPPEAIELVKKAAKVAVNRYDLKGSVIQDELMAARQALVDDTVMDIPKVDSPKVEERKYIRVLIEAEIEKALLKIKQELKELQHISWEHLDIPLSFFNIELMHVLGGEGWCYKDTYRGDIAKASGCKEDTVIMTRIQNPSRPAKPDFTKRSVRERYTNGNIKN